MKVFTKTPRMPIIGRRGGISMTGGLTLQAADGSVIWLKLDAPSKGNDTWTTTHEAIAKKVFAVLSDHFDMKDTEI